MEVKIKTDGIDYIADLQSNSNNVALRTKIGGIDYKINLTFKDPVNENALKDYLRRSSTTKRIEALIIQHKILEEIYSYPDANIRITNSNKRTTAKIFYKKENYKKDHYTRKMKKISIDSEDAGEFLACLEQDKKKAKQKLESIRDKFNSLPPVAPNSEEETKRKEILKKASNKLEKRKVQLRKIDELKRRFDIQKSGGLFGDNFLENISLTTAKHKSHP
jgi:hypothetical protein